MPKPLLSFFIFLLSFNSIAQPAWKWGRNGGSEFDNFGAFNETVYDIASDKKGNTYVLSRVYAAGLHVAGGSVPAYGVVDILLSSFSCDGAHRWSKVIGGSDLNDEGVAIGTDTLGGVYVLGRIQMSPSIPGHFGDTQVNNTSKSLFLVKFDTTGDFKWLRMPQADTVFYTSYACTPIDMNVAGNGDVQILCSLVPGTYAGGAFVVTTTSINILKYNFAGIFSGIVAMDMNLTGLSMAGARMAIDRNTGRYYVSGTGDPMFGTVFIGGVYVTPNMYVASFNQQGQHLWTQKGVLTGNDLSGFWGRPQIDDSGFVYVTGVTSLGDTFANAHITTNSFGTPATALAFIAKLDSNANLIWSKNASASMSISHCYGALRGNDEMVVTGSYVAELEWPGYAGPHPHHSQLQGYDVFITRFNTHTGAVIKVDTLSSAGGNYELPSAIGYDGKNGVVIGGHYDLSVFVAGDTLTIPNSEPDFFIARYGEDCQPLQSTVVSSSVHGVSIYPNPATDELVISATVKIRKITITSALGQVLLHQDANSPKTAISIGHLPAAVYYLCTEDEHGTVRTARFVKH